MNRKKIREGCSPGYYSITNEESKIWWNRIAKQEEIEEGILVSIRCTKLASRIDEASKGISRVPKVGGKVFDRSSKKSKLVRSRDVLQLVIEMQNWLDKASKGISRKPRVRKRMYSINHLEKSKLVRSRDVLQLAIDNRMLKVKRSV